MRPIVYVDLVGLSEPAARQTLLDALTQRAKPERKPVFPEFSVPEPTTVTGQIIAEPKTFPSAVSQIQQIKAKGLQTQLDNLMSDYEALNQQISYTTDAVERKRRERQLEVIAEDLDKVATELDGLGA